MYVNSILSRCEVVSSFPPCFQGNMTHISGPEYLQIAGYTIPLWIDIVALLTFWIVFHVLGYLLIRYLRKPRALN